MTKIFSELNESALKMMIADRVVSSQAQHEKASATISQSQMSNTSNLVANEPSVDAASIMHAFLKY